MNIKLRHVAWPPLVDTHRLPRWVLLRDMVITLLAWATLAFLLRDLIRLGINYFNHPFFQLTDMAPPNMPLLWARLRPYAEVIAFLVVWLLVSVLVLLRKARGRRLRPQPAALHVAQHAQAFGLEGETVSEWQQQRVLLLRLSPEGQLESGQRVIPQQP